MNTYTTDTLAQMFERHLSHINIPDEPQRLYAPIRYSLMQGGKRLRPTLLLLAYNLFADDVESALDAALAIETFHNFTLLHDDIMDNAAVRRGRPSVHARWGANVAILSGDAMLISAYTFLKNIPPQILPAVLETFNRMAVQVCEGQQYDMDFESRRKVAVVEYMNMIALKTSALLAGAAATGAIMAGAPERDVQTLSRFASELGMAFQLQDDLLDSYGDENLGKKIGGDILEGKKTYLMVAAMSKATEEQRQVLRSTHTRADLTDAQKIAAVKALYDELDIPRTTRRQISVRFARALAMLDALAVPQERTAQLRIYSESLMGRNR